jgi:hypothetical protein
VEFEARCGVVSGPASPICIAASGGSWIFSGVYTYEYTANMGPIDSFYSSDRNFDFAIQASVAGVFRSLHMPRIFGEMLAER